MAKEPQPKDNGKGANFVTTANPFKNGGRPHHPEVSDTAGFASAVDALIRKGCAVLIGATRDGGALCLTILDGADRHRTYCSNQEDFDEAIGAVLVMYGD